MSEIKAPAFKDTAEQSEKLQEVIAKYKGTEGALIPTLHEAQAIYGYLPYEVQKKISEGLMWIIPLWLAKSALEKTLKMGAF